MKRKRNSRNDSKALRTLQKMFSSKTRDEEFASAGKILEKISEWESKDKKSHDDYLFHLADVFELFARVDLLKSCWITEVFCSSSSLVIEIWRQY